MAEKTDKNNAPQGYCLNYNDFVFIAPEWIQYSLPVTSNKTKQILTNHYRPLFLRTNGGLIRGFHCT